MARQVGLAFTGRIDGLSFYHDKLHGYLVRRTGGVSSKQYLTQERYAAARDASAEFSNVSHTGKLIRDALQPFIQPIKDGTMVNRLNKELVALKQLDNLHSRGKRKPETMMVDMGANTFFRIFQFNENVKAYELTVHFPVILRQQNALVMTVEGLLPSAFPQSATHAGLTLVRTVIDFEKGRFETHSSRMAVVSPDNKDELLLEIQETSSCAGIELICLQVVFFREQNGDLVQLPGAVHSMGVIGVNELELAVVEREAIQLSKKTGRKVVVFSGKKAGERVLRRDYWYDGSSPPV